MLTLVVVILLSRSVYWSVGCPLEGAWNYLLGHWSHQYSWSQDAGDRWPHVRAIKRAKQFLYNGGESGSREPLLSQSRTSCTGPCTASLRIYYSNIYLNVIFIAALDRVPKSGQWYDVVFFLWVWMSWKLLLQGNSNIPEHVDWLKHNPFKRDRIHLNEMATQDIPNNGAH